MNSTANKDHYKAAQIFKAFDTEDAGFWSESDFSEWLEKFSDNGVAIDEQTEEWLYRTFLAASLPDSTKVTHDLLEQGISEEQVLAFYCDECCRERLREAARTSARSKKVKGLFEFDLAKHYDVIAWESALGEGLGGLLPSQYQAKASRPATSLLSSQRQVVRQGVQLDAYGCFPRKIKPNPAEPVPAVPWSVPRPEVTADSIAKVRGKPEKDFSADDVALLLYALWQAYAAPETQSKLRNVAAACGSTCVPDYFTFIEKETARLQKPIFEEFGIPAPPKGLAMLRRLTARYEKASDAAVQHIAWQCRLILGVEQGLLIFCTRAVPFFVQAERMNCLQTNLQMILKWYLPDKHYPMEELNERTGRTDTTKWSCASQAMPFLLEEGFVAHYHTNGPFEELLTRGEEFFTQHYGKELGELLFENADLESMQLARRKLRDRYENRYTQHKIAFAQVDEAMQRDDTVVILLVDYMRLFSSDASRKRASVYNGHFITLTGVGRSHYQFHDSLSQANKVVSKEEVKAAWDAPGTDNDCIVIHGLVKNQGRRQ